MANKDIKDGFTNNIPINWDASVDHPEAGMKNRTIPAFEEIIWSDNPYTWGDVSLLLEIIDGIGTINRRARLDWYLNKHPNKKKRLVRLICRVRGEKVYDETKEISEVKVTLEDVDMVIKEVLGTIKVENVDVL